jgi:hypothetical protein
MFYKMNFWPAVPRESVDPTVARHASATAFPSM